MSNYAKDEHIDLLTVNINDAHCWNGLTVSEIGTPDHFLPAMVIRDGEALIPIDTLRIKNGDKVILAADTYFAHPY